ncbi:MAG: hypothetical protein FWE14_06160 [Lachnospiraceae bacterium]|nr:hypothetical protein [Lachnospiraceae bacterium]
MKNTILKRFFVLLAIIALFPNLLGASVKSDFGNNISISSRGYSYPVRPNMQEWSVLYDHMDMIAACQIPDEYLRKMSTAELVQSFLNYPLLIDMFVYSTYDMGYKAVSMVFNGLQELENREDAGTELLKTYQSAMPVLKEDFINEGFIVTEDSIRYPGETEQTNEYTDSELRLYDRMHYLNALEILLSQEIFLQKLSDNEINLLAEEANKKFEIKSEENDIYGYTLSMSSSISDSISSTSGIMPLGSLSYFHSGLGRTVFYNNGSVRTPNNTLVSTMVHTTTLTTAEINSLNSSLGSAYPNATRQANASLQYNCHSHAWITSGHGTHWMNNPASYWTDGSYTTTASTKSRVVFFGSNGSVTHSGKLVTPTSSPTSNTTIQSKWGTGGLYNHSHTHNPYYIAPLVEPWRHYG